jgi:hypothetical protein
VSTLEEDISALENVFAFKQDSLTRA